MESNLLRTVLKAFTDGQTLDSYRQKQISQFSLEESIDLLVRELPQREKIQPILQVLIATEAQKAIQSIASQLEAQLKVSSEASNETSRLTREMITESKWLGRYTFVLAVATSLLALFTAGILLKTH